MLLCLLYRFWPFVSIQRPLGSACPESGTSWERVETEQEGESSEAESEAEGGEDEQGAIAEAIENELPDG